MCQNLIYNLEKNSAFGCVLYFVFIKIQVSVFIGKNGKIWHRRSNQVLYANILQPHEVYSYFLEEKIIAKSSMNIFTTENQN